MHRVPKAKRGVEEVMNLSQKLSGRSQASSAWLTACLNLHCFLFCYFHSRDPSANEHWLEIGIGRLSLSRRSPAEESSKCVTVCLTRVILNENDQ